MNRKWNVLHVVSYPNYCTVETAFQKVAHLPSNALRHCIRKNKTKKEIVQQLKNVSRVIMLYIHCRDSHLFRQAPCFIQFLEFACYCYMSVVFLYCILLAVMTCNSTIILPVLNAHTKQPFLPTMGLTTKASWAQILISTSLICLFCKLHYKKSIRTKKERGEKAETTKSACKAPVYWQLTHKS